MRVIPFPSDEPLPGHEEWIVDLQAALDGRAQGAAADAWRELRGDVRSLAPPMTPESRASLERRLAHAGALGTNAPAAQPLPAHQDSSGAARAASTREPREGSHRALARVRRAPRTLATHRRPAVAAATAAAIALVGGLVAWQGGPGSSVETNAPTQKAPAVTSSSTSHTPSAAGSSPAAHASSKTFEKSAPTPGAASGAQSAAPSSPLEGGAVAGQASGRVQQLAASVTLTTTPSNVQAVADQVGQLTVRDGGYVQSSNVQVQQQGTSEATLALKLPSARLGAALAAIGRLAPVRAENQSLQDITNSYNAAHQQLSDAIAQRQALLRALAAATTEGQIDSLRERLAEARNAVAHAQNAFNALSKRASTAEVEVSVIGNAKAETEGLTVHRALSDAGHILLITLTAILILAAVILPIALALAAILAARRAIIRYRRERALNTP